MPTAQDHRTAPRSTEPEPPNKSLRQYWAEKIKTPTPNPSFTLPRYRSSVKAMPNERERERERERETRIKKEQ